MSNALASLASREPMRPRPTISRVLPPSSSSRARDVGDHAAPVLRGLVVAPGVDVPLQGQDQRHGVLGHGVRH